MHGPYYVAELRFPEHSEFYLVRWVCSTSWWDLDGTAYPAKQPISRKQYERAVRLGKPHRLYLMTSETAPGKVVSLAASGGSQFR